MMHGNMNIKKDHQNVIEIPREYRMRKVAEHTARHNPITQCALHTNAQEP
jgi:hypothetical protein